MRLTDWCSDGRRSTCIFRSPKGITREKYFRSPGLLRMSPTSLVVTVSPQCVNTLVLPATVLFVRTVRKYRKAFMVQMRIQCDSYVSVVDTRPPTASQTALQPRAPEPLHMPCIIHAHTRSICPNAHFPVSAWKILSSHSLLDMEPDLR